MREALEWEFYDGLWSADVGDSWVAFLVIDRRGTTPEDSFIYKGGRTIIPGFDALPLEERKRLVETIVRLET